MLKIVRKTTSNRYNGTVVVTKEQVEKIEKTFSTKFEAFKYGVEQQWTMKCIMKYCLDTERHQYFYNYMIKLQATK